MKLKEGVGFNAILDTIRDQEINIDNFRREILLERQDFFNISRDFNIDYATKRNSNDAISVHLWIKEMRNQEMTIQFCFTKIKVQLIRI